MVLLSFTDCIAARAVYDPRSEPLDPSPIWISERFATESFLTHVKRSISHQVGAFRVCRFGFIRAKRSCLKEFDDTETTITAFRCSRSLLYTFMKIQVDSVF